MVPYYKTLTYLVKSYLTHHQVWLKSLEEIQVYIEECEQKRLDLDNEEVWPKAYLPVKRTAKA